MRSSCAGTSVNLDNDWNNTALKACVQAKSHWYRSRPAKARVSTGTSAIGPSMLMRSRRRSGCHHPWSTLSSSASRALIVTDDHPACVALLVRSRACRDQETYLRWTVVCDFEYECAPGGLPSVLSMVAYVLDENLQHVRTIRLGVATSDLARRSTSDRNHCLWPIAPGRINLPSPLAGNSGARL